MPTYERHSAPGGAGGSAGYHGSSERYPVTSNLRPAQAELKLIEWRPVVKTSLRGFATVELTAVGLVIRDVVVLAGRNGPWASLPAKPQIDRDGRPKLGSNGRPAYSSILEWRDRELSDHFSAALVAAIRDRQPDALEG
jgi:hypothetical protein